MSEPLPLLTIDQAAEWLKVTPAQLAAHRYRGTGPRFIKVTGRQIRYRVSDLDEWVDTVAHTQSARRPRRRHSAA